MEAKPTPKQDAAADAAGHGAVLLLGFASLVLLPARLRVWPLPLVLPLAVYALIIAAAPRLRRSAAWIRAGSLTPRVAVPTAVLILAAGAALFLYQHHVRPPLGHLRVYIPFEALGGATAGGVVFSLLNALLEEAIFRGILLDAVRVSWGWQAALLVTSAAFGLGHLGGYPPGPLGAVLAGIFGLALGLLRLHSGGLLAPVIAHAGADAAIWTILAAY